MSPIKQYFFLCYYKASLNLSMLIKLEIFEVPNLHCSLRVENTQQAGSECVGSCPTVACRNSAKKNTPHFLN